MKNYSNPPRKPDKAEELKQKLIETIPKEKPKLEPKEKIKEAGRGDAVPKHQWT